MCNFQTQFFIATVSILSEIALNWIESYDINEKTKVQFQIMAKWVIRQQAMKGPMYNNVYITSWHSDIQID